MTIAGSVTIASDGTASGAGLALALYNLLIALPTYSGIPAGAAGAATKRQVADPCNVFATIADGPKFAPTEIKTATYHAAPGDFVLCDPTAGLFQVVLPTPTADMSGKMIAVKNVTTSTNLIVVAPFIDVSVVNMNQPRGGLIAICDFATGWYPLGNAATL